MRLFYRDWLDYVDLKSLTIENNELLTSLVIPDGSRRYVDFVVRINLNAKGRLLFSGKECLLAIVETEKGSISDLRIRMPQYHEFLEIGHPDAVVFLTGLYLDTALNGIGVDKSVKGQPLGIPTKWAPGVKPKRARPLVNHKIIEWYYVGLPGLKVKDYRKFLPKNPLVAALIGFMELEEGEEKTRFQAEVTLQICDYPKLDLDTKELLAYALSVGLNPSADETRRFRELIQMDPRYKRVETMATTWFREGKLEGQREGKLEGKLEGIQEMVLRLLASRFPLTDFVKKQIQKMDATQLEQLFDNALDSTKSLKDLGLAT